jgi:two-component system LytT family response regulator
MIVDGQETSIHLLREHIRMFSDLHLKASFADPREALVAYELYTPDLIFLEVHMPYLNGMEFIAALKTKAGRNMPVFVFVSDCDKYALSGYDHGVMDYLLKPVSFQRFKVCMDRLKNSLQRTTSVDSEFFFADMDGRKVKVIYRDILFVEAAGNYVIIATHQGNITLYKTMSGMQRILPEGQFIRVHKSYIISIYPIREISGNEIVLNYQNKTRVIPIGATYKEELLKRLTIV